MNDLRQHDWLNSSKICGSCTPLVTPGVLSLNPSSMTSVQRQIKVTMDSFHEAYREGFRLQDVTKAPLAQRRRKKKSSERSSSSESGHSHGSLTPTKNLGQSPMRNSPVRNLSNNSQSSTHSTGFTPLGGAAAGGQLGSNPKTQSSTSSMESSGYFSFKEARIKQLMPTVTETGRGATCKDIEEIPVTATVPVPHIGGVKRKHDSDEVIAIDDDDDCVIVGEGPAVQRQTEVLATNNNNAKRPRSETILIE